MRVAMYYNNDDVRLEEIPCPEIEKDEMLMQVNASGICGTDVLDWYRVKRAPLVLGHEVSGIVAETGKGVKKYNVGDRIAVAHHVPCNNCHYCLSGHHTVCETLRKTNFLPGGFSEYIRLPKIIVEQGVFLLPDEVSFEEATFVEPLACVVRGQRLVNLKKDMSLLVMGCGVSGLLHIKLAKLKGVGKVFATDIQEYRLNKAKESGADFVFNAKEDVANNVRKLNEGRLVDSVILCTGASLAYSQALQSVGRGGTILFFAAAEAGFVLPVSINDVFWRNEITFTSSYAGSPTDHIEALKLIGSHKINVLDLITHRLKLDEAGLGFKLVAEAKGSLKVIIIP
jgi:L-iditol 2-dehydrogenase